MQLTSPVFIFLLLAPLFLLIRLLPAGRKNVPLTLLSCLLIAWGSPRDALLVLLGAAFNYFTARTANALRAAQKERPAKAVIAAGAAADLLWLLFFKYTGFAVGIFGGSLPPAFPAAPIGVSFYTFSAISYLTDTARDDAPAGFWDTALYLTFFPKFLSGPIVPYRDFRRDLRRAASGGDVARGFARFVIGLAKKVLLADTLSGLFAQVFAAPLASLTAAEAWLGALTYAFTLYFDFSGYSDMAIGLSGLCGFQLEENFDHPYLSAGMTEFWRRWHISLGRWFRDQVYIPLGGSRRGNAVTARNLAVVWLLTGLWHGANWTFLLWGAYHALLLLAEKFIFKHLKQKLPRRLNVGPTFLLAVLGWVPFFSPDIRFAGGYLMRLIGVGGAGFVNGSALFLLSQSAVPLLLAAVGATTLPQALGNRLLKKPYGRILLAVGAAAALLLCTAAIIGGTGQSFLYAAF